MTSVIRFECHNCLAQIAMPISSAGRTGKCGKCGSKLAVPAGPSNSDRSEPSETQLKSDQVAPEIFEDTYSLSKPHDIPTGSANQSRHPQPQQDDDAQPTESLISTPQEHFGDLRKVSREKASVRNPTKTRLVTEEAALAGVGQPAQEGVKRHLVRFAAWLWLSSSLLLLQIGMLVPGGRISYVVRALIFLALCPALFLTCRKARHDFGLLRRCQKQLKEILKDTCPNWVDDFVIESESVQLFATARRLYTERKPKLGEAPSVGISVGTGQGNLLGNVILTSKRLMFISGDGEQRSRKGSWLIDTIESTYVRSQGREFVVYAGGNRFSFDSTPPSRMSELLLAIRGLCGEGSTKFQVGQTAEAALDLYDATLGLIDMPGGFSLEGAIEGAQIGAAMGNPILGAVIIGFEKGKLTPDQMRSRAKQALLDRGYPANSDELMAVLIGALRNTNPAALVDLIQCQHRPSRLAALCALRDMGPNGASALPIVRPILDDADVELRRYATDAFTVLMEADRASNR